MKRFTLFIFLIICIKAHSQNLDKMQSSIDSLKAIKTDYLNKIKGIDILINEIENKKTITEFERFEKMSYTVPIQPNPKIRDKDNSNGQILFELKKGEVMTLIDFDNDYWLVSYSNAVGYVNDVFIQQSPSINDFKKYLVAKRIQLAEENNKMEAQKAEQDRILNAKKEEENRKLLAQKNEQNKKLQAHNDSLNLIISRARLEKRTKDLASKYGTEVANKIIAGKIWLGMTDAMSKESWGLPNDINRTVGNWGVHEQWIYPSNVYLYFENGVLTSWQD